MNDLVVRLRLNSTQWDTSINSAKNSIQSFSKIVGNVSIDNFNNLIKTGANLVGKFAVGIGAATTVQETFTKIMRSSQTTSDAFDNTLNAAKSSVDSFFISLSTGRWDAFNDGLLVAFNRAKDLSAIMDALADRQLSYSYIKTEDLSNIEKYEQMAKDTNLSLEQRKDAAEKMSQTIKELSKNTNDLIQAKQDALIKSYKATYGIDVTIDEIDFFLKNTNIDDSEVKKYLEQRKKLEQKYTLPITYSPTTGAQVGGQLSAEGKRVLEQYDKQNEYIRKQSILLDETDEKRKSMVQTLIETKNLEKEIYSLQKRADETSRGVNSSSTSTSLSKVKGSVEKEIIPKGSFAEIDAKIKDLKNKLQNATSDGVRFAIQEELEKTYTLKVMMENRSKGTDLLDDSIKTQGKNPLEDINSGNLPKLNFDNDGLKESINMYDDLGESLLGVTNILSSLDGTVSDSASGWLKYASTVISSVAASIKPIQDLTVALQAKAVAEAAGSAASVPVVGWIKAIAAITAVMAAFASIPKNANGGIIGGNSFVGDNVLIRANSGEMILNKRQQANLFNLLDNGYGTKGNITNGNVEFRIQGKELVGVLQAYNNKTSKFS